MWQNQATMPERSARLRQAASLSLAATTMVVVVKLWAAQASRSVSVTAEALQSLVDIAVALGVLQMVKLASQPADERHPYGHGKAEILMGAAQALLILASAGFILVEAIRRLGKPQEILPPAGIIAISFAIVVDLLVSGYVRKVAEQENSAALRTESLHLRGDALMGAGVLSGLVLVQFTGISWIDPVCAILFTLFVVVGAIKLFSKLIHDLMDGSLPFEDLEKLRQVLRQDSHVKGFHNVRTRSLGTTRYVELHVLLEDTLTFVDAHEHAERIESALSEALGGAHVNIHFEPFEVELRHRKERHGNDDWEVLGREPQA